MRVFPRAAAAASLAAGGYLATCGDEGRRAALLGLARLDERLRPALATVLPAEAFVCLYSASRAPFLRALGASAGGDPAPAPAAAAAPPLRAMGLSFRNDLGNAAGLDKDGTLLDLSYGLGAGFAVVGTVLSEPHTGNVFRFLGGLWEGNAWTPLPLSGGALNSLGLPSKGVDEALRNIAAFRERRGVAPQRVERGAGAGSRSRAAAPAAASPPAAFPIGVSIMGHPAHGDAAQKLEGVLHCVRRALPLADFIEINESCPNVHHGGGGGGGGGATVELRKRLQAVVAVRDAAAREQGGRRVPILVKLGDLGDPKETVRFLSRLGIDGVVALNTQKDYDAFELPDADRGLLQFYTQRHGGGLSGPPIRERSIAQVAAAQRAVRQLRLENTFTVIHVGGLQCGDDVRASRATGAELRQWYTGLMHGLAQPAPESLYSRITAA